MLFFWVSIVAFDRPLPLRGLMDEPGGRWVASGWRLAVGGWRSERLIIFGNLVLCGLPLGSVRVISASTWRRMHRLLDSEKGNKSISLVRRGSLGEPSDQTSISWLFLEEGCLSISDEPSQPHQRRALFACTMISDTRRVFFFSHFFPSYSSSLLLLLRLP